MSTPGEHEHPQTAPADAGRQEQRILSMTPYAKAPTSVEAVLRLRIDELSQAIRDRDVERLMTFYAPDVVAFDLHPPRKVRGAGEYRQNFERWFASFDGPIGFEYHDLRIAPGDGAAFCHYLALVTGPRPDGRISGYWVRGTTCFEQLDGRWLVTHEHISTPAPM